MAPSARLRAALAAIDDANAADPTLVTVRGRTGPKEIMHADLVTEWVLRLQARRRRGAAARGARAPLPALDGAAHELSRRAAPATCAGARTCTRNTRSELGVAARRRGLRRRDDRARAGDRAQGRPRARGEHDDVQVLEDALCLVFLETQLVDIAARLDPDTLPGVITKTAHEDERGRARR